MDVESTTAPVGSAIIVSWNAMAYVEECLGSLRNNTEVPLEVIVSDNASSDGTVAMVREKFPEVRLLQSGGNLGFARGNNLGIAVSRGRYLFLINSDVNVLPGSIEKIVTYMDAHPEVGMLGPQMLDRERKVRRSTMKFPTLWNQFCRALALDGLPGGTFLPADESHTRTREVDVLNGWFWVLRREALEQVGGLDERFFMYGEDIDWSYRFSKAGWKRVFYAEAAAVHYGGSSSAAAPIRFHIEQHRANLQLWEIHRSRLACRLFRAIIALHELLRVAGFAVVCVLRPGSRTESRYKIERSLAALRWLLGGGQSEKTLGPSPAKA